MSGAIAKAIAGGLMVAAFGYLALRAMGYGRDDTVLHTAVAGERGRMAMASMIGSARSLYAEWQTRRADRRERRLAAESQERGDILTRLAPRPAMPRGGRDGTGQRIEPKLTRDDRRPILDPDPEVEAGMEEEGYGEAEDDIEEIEEEDEEEAAPRVNRNTKPIKQGKKIKKDTQPGFRFGGSNGFELPPLTLLAEPKRLAKTPELSDEALEQNARMLEGVLEDFGVKGQIIKVRPGPVVTLYELEPAPGIKSSRVISLADDIARSMSADLGPRRRRARAAMPSASNCPMPSARPSTCANCSPPKPIEKTSLNLALALGKNIGGEPIFADLARMPHRADRRHHRLGQVGRHQHHDPVAALPPAARALQADHDRSQDAGILRLRRHSASAVAGRHRSAQGGGRAEMGGARDGRPLSQDVEARRAQHRWLQCPHRSRPRPRARS